MTSRRVASELTGSKHCVSPAHASSSRHGSWCRRALPSRIGCEMQWVTAAAPATPGVDATTKTARNPPQSFAVNVRWKGKRKPLPVELTGFAFAAISLCYGLIQRSRSQTGDVSSARCSASTVHHNSRATAWTQTETLISECPDSKFACKLQDQIVAKTS